MNCCEKCFKSKIIISLIRGLNVKGECTFCLNSNVFIYDLENHEGLDEKLI